MEKTRRGERRERKIKNEKRFMGKMEKKYNQELNNKIIYKFTDD